MSGDTPGLDPARRLRDAQGSSFRSLGGPLAAARGPSSPSLSPRGTSSHPSPVLGSRGGRRLEIDAGMILARAAVSPHGKRARPTPTAACSAGRGPPRRPKPSEAQRGGVPSTVLLVPYLAHCIHCAMQTRPPPRRSQPSTRPLDRVVQACQSAGGQRRRPCGEVRRPGRLRNSHLGKYRVTLPSETWLMYFFHRYQPGVRRVRPTPNIH